MKISKGLLMLTTTQTGLAQALGISQQRVSQLLRDKVLTKDDAGNVLVVESLKNYYKSRSDNSGEEDVELSKERALHERVKRELAEIELAKRKNEVHETADVELVMTDMLANLRSQLLSIPAKMAPLLTGKTQDEINTALADEIQTRLTELSDYRPEMFSDVEETGGDGDDQADG